MPEKSEEKQAAESDEQKAAENAEVTTVTVADRDGNEFDVPTGYDGKNPVSPDNPPAKAFYSENDKAKHQAYLDEGVASEGDDYGVDQLSLGDRGFDERETDTQKVLSDDGKEPSEDPKTVEKDQSKSGDQSKAPKARAEAAKKAEK